MQASNWGGSREGRAPDSYYSVSRLRQNSLDNKREQKNQHPKNRKKKWSTLPKENTLFRENPFSFLNESLSKI